MSYEQAFALIKQAEREQWTGLDLSGMGLYELPPEIGRLTQLEELTLGYREKPLRFNYLQSVPSRIAHLTNLHTLDLRYNRLTALPDWMAQLTNLHTLYLSRLKLTELPSWMARLTNLRTLDLSSNQLTVLPDWMAQLTNLQTLDLRYNKLTALPDWMAQLTNLQTLDLSSNKLTALPDWIAQLLQLQKLYVSENPITEPPPEVLEDALKFVWNSADIDAIRDYFRQLQDDGKAYFYEAKLLLVGEGGTGKSSLATKLKDANATLPDPDDSTRGIDILEWGFGLPSNFPNPKNDRYRVHIWDFGGQTIYYATHQFFLTKRSVYVLLADTRQEHTRFYDWLRMQESFGDNSPVMLVKNLNRSHGNEFHIGNLDNLRQRFPNLKEVLEVDLKEVPNARGWAKLLRRLQTHFLELDHIGQPRPATWVNVRRALDDDPRDLITLPQYFAICRQQGIDRDDDALQLSGYLHNLGDILHFKDDPLLKQIIILNPTWGLDAVYRALDYAKIPHNAGRFHFSELSDLWGEEKYAGHQSQLLRLMQNFQLCYELPNQRDYYIAPQLLGIEQPAYEWDNQDNLLLRYHYPVFMPRGLLSRAIVKLHQRIEDQSFVWRNGVIMRDKHARAELLELRGEQQIRIRVVGGNPRDLLMEIVRALDELHRSFPKLRYDKLIPCNCATCINLNEPHFYPLDDLLDRLAYNKHVIGCNMKPTFHDVPIRGLIDKLPAIDRRLRQNDPPHTTIYNIQGDYQRGNITVGDLNNVSGVAIGDNTKASIRNSFNTLQYAANLNGDVRQLLKQLILEIEAINYETNVEDAQNMAEDAGNLVTEANKEKPRKRNLNAYLEGIVESADNLGSIATPITDTTTKLIPLLIPLETLPRE